jgi:hypothetical protein
VLDDPHAASKNLQAPAVPQAMPKYTQPMRHCEATHLCGCDAQRQQQHCNCALHTACGSLWSSVVVVLSRSWDEVSKRCVYCV